MYKHARHSFRSGHSSAELGDQYIVHVIDNLAEPLHGLDDMVNNKWGTRSVGHRNYPVPVMKEMQISALTFNSFSLS
ncbi:hypothetical protein JCM31598_36980 [Desulfonatronum parangueonense]